MENPTKTHCLLMEVAGLLNGWSVKLWALTSVGDDHSRAVRPAGYRKIRETHNVVRTRLQMQKPSVLVIVLGRDDAFGLVWPLVHLIESAPGWPLADCLQDPNHERIQMLKQRADNATR